MAYKMKGFSGFKVSPAKQKADTTKTYPKSYTKKDIEFLKEQREDVVRYEDLDEKGKAIWRKQGKPVPKKKKSPAKQEGPIPKENIKLQKGEMEGTWIYKGKDKSERIIDLEDRAEFARSDAESAKGKEKKQHLANAKKLQHEADIIRNRKPNKKK
tara:strand:- start:207 stop:674 length:468 start_codon:yes stop_codon:yes gene_type:complete